MTRRSLRRLAIIVVTCIAMATWSLADGPSTGQQIMKQGEIRAFVSGQSWCQEVVHTVVHAPTAEPFQGDRIEAQRMIGHLRIALSEECPSAAAIMIDGFGGGIHVYTGMASRTKGWILEETKPPAVADLVTDCDLLAAHPDDPQKNRDATGIEDEDMDGDMAVSACLDDVEAGPDDAVSRFQLGRGYWKAGLHKKAIEQFLPAAEANHGGAIAYLGDAVLHGVAGLEQDPELARLLYARAAQEGFLPAADFADSIVLNPKTDEPKLADGGGSPEENAEKQDDYHYPELIQVLSSGRVEAPGVWSGRMMVYSFSSITGVFSQCENLSPKGFDSKDSFLKAMNSKLTYTEKLNLTHSYEDGAFSEFQEAASEDGARLAVTMGCSANETKTLVKTILDYYVAG